MYRSRVEKQFFLNEDIFHQRLQRTIRLSLTGTQTPLPETSAVISHTPDFFVIIKRANVLFPNKMLTARFLSFILNVGQKNNLGKQMFQ